MCLAIFFVISKVAVEGERKKFCKEKLFTFDFFFLRNRWESERGRNIEQKYIYRQRDEHTDTHIHTLYSPSRWDTNKASVKSKQSLWTRSNIPYEPDLVYKKRQNIRIQSKPILKPNLYPYLYRRHDNTMPMDRASWKTPKPHFLLSLRSPLCVLSFWSIRFSLSLPSFLHDYKFKSTCNTLFDKFCIALWDWRKGRERMEEMERGKVGEGRREKDKSIDQKLGR